MKGKAFENPLFVQIALLSFIKRRRRVIYRLRAIEKAILVDLSYRQLFLISPYPFLRPANYLHG